MAHCPSQSRNKSSILFHVSRKSVHLRQGAIVSLSREVYPSFVKFNSIDRTFRKSGSVNIPKIEFQIPILAARLVETPRAIDGCKEGSAHATVVVRARFPSHRRNNSSLSHPGPRKQVIKHEAEIFHHPLKFRQGSSNLN